MLLGYEIGVIEIFIIFSCSALLRQEFVSLKSLNRVVYYWLIFTIVTGLFWEPAYVYYFKEISEYSHSLVETRRHVWTSYYNPLYILPWRLSAIFYAEYGAWADRDYMNINNDWSRVIESTHSIFSGLFAIIALASVIKHNHNKFILSLGISMGTQLMNSILYLTEYFIQTKDITSVNYDNSSFPTGGRLLLNRPFMWVNIFWTIMPLYVIIVYLSKYKSKNHLKIDEKKIIINDR